MDTLESLHLTIKNQTIIWVEEFVIRLNLCPFAKHPFKNELIRFSVLPNANLEEAMNDFWREILIIDEKGPQVISNSLAIFPNGFEKYSDYLDFYYLCEELLNLQGVSDKYQLASFHPDYQFAEIDKEDARNFSNRSPYPMIHILRVDEMQDAINKYPNTLEIPENNRKKLEEIGTLKLKQMLKSFSENSDREHFKK